MKYIGGNSISVADIQIYCEIAQLLPIAQATSDEDLLIKYPKVKSWIQNISSLPEMTDLDKQLKVIIDKFKLAEQ